MTPEQRKMALGSEGQYLGTSARARQLGLTDFDSSKTGVRKPFARLAAREGLPFFMPQPPRKMHWNLVPSGKTACGKDAVRCRTTADINHWRNLKLAGGRRCLRCLQYVGQTRKFDEPKAVAP